MAETTTNTEIINITPKRRESIIISSILFNKSSREFAIRTTIDSSLIEEKTLRKILDIFNGLTTSNIRPSIDMIIEQYYPKDGLERQRKNLKEKLYALKDKCPPQEADMLKEHIYLINKHKSLEILDNILNKARSRVQEEYNNPSFNKENVTIDYLKNQLDKLLENFVIEETKALNLSEGLKKEIESLYVKRKNPDKKEYCDSGYTILNKILSGGIQKNNFTLICARPGMGKTVFMLNQALNSAINGQKTLFLSIEMSIEQCMQRILSNISKVKLEDILQPENLSESDLEHLKYTAKTKVKSFGDNLFIEEVDRLTTSELESKIKYYKKHLGVELIFVDYVQIMSTKNGTKPKDEADFREISGDLREMTKRHKVAVVLGSQLSRKVEERENKRPMDSDLRNSGSFEQDACTIIHLYRDSVYNKDTEEKNVLEVIFGKNRFGTSNVTVKLPYDYSTQTIFTTPVTQVA